MKTGLRWGAIGAVLLCLAVSAGAQGTLTPTAGQGLMLLGANPSSSSTGNSAWVYSANYTLQGVTGQTYLGHGLAYGDVYGNGGAELVVGTQGSSNTNYAGAFVYNTSGTAVGDYITYQNGDGVAIGSVGGTSRIFVGSQYASNTNAEGAYIFNASPNNDYVGSLITNQQGGGVAFGTNVTGDGNPGVVIGIQSNGTYGADYFEYVSSSWQFVTSLVTWSGTGSGIAIGNIDGNGIQSTLVAVGNTVQDFQYTGGAFVNLAGAGNASINCGAGNLVEAIATGSVTGVGAHDVLVEVDSGGYLDGLLYQDNGNGSFQLLGSVATGMSASGGTGAAIVNAVAVPEPASIVTLLGGLFGAAGLAIRRRK